MRGRFLLGLVMLSSCSGADGLDARMKTVIGSDETALVAAMRRPPDSRAELASDVSSLQWYWRQTYAIPDRLLTYSYGGGTIQPIARTGTGLVRDECFVEWTVEHGIARAYRWQGAACGLVARNVGLPEGRQ